MSHPLKWEFPGGKVEEGESYTECLRREIREELDIEIEILKKIDSNIHCYQVGTKIELIPFVCRYIKGNLSLKEHHEVVWLEASALKTLDWAAADIPIVEQIMKYSFPPSFQ